MRLRGIVPRDRDRFPAFLVPAGSACALFLVRLTLSCSVVKIKTAQFTKKQQMGLSILCLTAAKFLNDQSQLPAHLPGHGCILLRPSKQIWQQRSDDRKNVVKGKGGVGREDLGGCR